jgi:hypothetical protein
MLYPAELPGQAQQNRIIACCLIDRIHPVCSCRESRAVHGDSGLGVQLY